MKITHTCTQCKEPIIYDEALHGKNEAEEIRTQGFADHKVYIFGTAPRVAVVMKVSTYQSYEEVCRACAIKALKKVIDEL